MADAVAHHIDPVVVLQLKIEDRVWTCDAPEDKIAVIHEDTDDGWLIIFKCVFTYSAYGQRAKIAIRVS